MKVIKIKTGKNIRDLGGQYQNVKIKEGMLIRGTALLHTSLEDQKILVNDNHMRTIIDLRSTDEQNIDKELDIPGTTHISMPVFEREKQGVSHTEKEKKKKNSMELYRNLPQMKDIYVDMVQGLSLENIAKIIKRVVNAKDEEYGIYFHCSEGKDRTGIIAAILLLILGVSRKEILKDYLYTNRVNNKKAFKYYMSLKYLHFHAIFALKVGRMFIAKKQYLNVLFDVIDNKYNGEQNFFNEAMGLTIEEIKGFKKKMIIS